MEKVFHEIWLTILEHHYSVFQSGCRTLNNSSNNLNIEICFESWYPTSDAPQRYLTTGSMICSTQLWKRPALYLCATIGKISGAIRWMIPTGWSQKNLRFDEILSDFSINWAPEVPKKSQLNMTANIQIRVYKKRNRWYLLQKSRSRFSKHPSM